MQAHKFVTIAQARDDNTVIISHFNISRRVSSYLKIKTGLPRRFAPRKDNKMVCHQFQEE
jgi:hypothetical protein